MLLTTFDFIFQVQYFILFSGQSPHGSSLSVSENIPAKWESQRIWNPGSPCYWSLLLLRTHAYYRTRAAAHHSSECTFDLRSTCKCFLSKPTMKATIFLILVTISTQVRGQYYQGLMNYLESRMLAMEVRIICFVWTDNPFCNGNFPTRDTRHSFSFLIFLEDH